MHLEIGLHGPAAVTANVHGERHLPIGTRQRRHLFDRGGPGQHQPGLLHARHLAEAQDHGPAVRRHRADIAHRPCGGEQQQGHAQR